MSVSDELVSLAELARLTGVDKATLVKRLDSLPLVTDTPRLKEYRLGEALKELYRRQNTELEDAKTRRAVAEADLKELQLAQERGDLLPVFDVRERLHRIFANLHQRFAAQMPKDLKYPLGRAETANEREQILQAHVDRVFHELRANHTDFL